jgi:two-component system response regulator MprA
MGKAVLLVDDDPLVREALSAALGLGGYRVIEAADGVEALEKVAEALPALIVLDLTMPRMDGLTFSKRLAEKGLRDAVPILVLSADGATREKAEEAGAEGFLRKPLDIRELLRKVAALTGE